MTDVSELLIHIKQKEDITNTVMDFGDLVASAEQLTAEIDGAKAGQSELISGHKSMFDVLQETCPE